MMRVHSGMLFEQVLAEARGGGQPKLSARSAQKGVYLSLLAEKGRTVDEAAATLRLKPATIKRLCKFWSIQLAA